MVNDTTVKGSLSVAEAGRLGGLAVTKKYPGHHARIGAIGGEKVARTRGAAFYSEIGAKGGNAVKASQGADFHSRIGRKGGEAIKAKYGPDYYSAIGKVGGASKRGV